MPLIDKRTDKTFAGERCQFIIPAPNWLAADRRPDTHRCMRYARYGVSADGDKTTTSIVCGQHVTDMVRRVWIESSFAAIVQEIPGMWRDKR